MEFNQLIDGTDCDCLEDSFQDLENTYCLKTNKNQLREVDFKSKWEKGERTSLENCKKVCSKKGKSISVLTEGNEVEIKNIFSQLFRLTPTYKPFITKIKFKEKSGVVKKTPSKRNIHHFDFYKCDEFELTNVNFIESIPIVKNV